MTHGYNECRSDEDHSASKQLEADRQPSVGAEAGQIHANLIINLARCDLVDLVLSVIGPDAWQTSEALAEISINGGPCDAVQPLQLQIGGLKVTIVPVKHRQDWHKSS